MDGNVLIRRRPQSQAPSSLSLSKDGPAHQPRLDRLPLWEVLVGTCYMTRDRLPQQFGTASSVPAGFIGQMRFPFRRS
jgi:hypothetical protein